MQRGTSPMNVSTSSNKNKQYVTQNDPNQRSRSVSPQIPLGQQTQPAQRPQSQNSQIFAPIGQPIIQPYLVTHQPQVQSTMGPVSSRHSQISTTSNQQAYMYIPCPSHPDLFITNICRLKECVEPLCPECITAHLEIHSRKSENARIENIQRVRKECIQSVYQQIDRLSKDSKELRQHGLDTQQSHYQSCIDNMKVQHQRILDMVDDYFEQLERELKEKMRGVEHLKKKYQELEGSVNIDIKELEQLAQELQGGNYVRYVIQQLDDEQNFIAKKKIQEFELAVRSYQDALPIIQNDQSYYERLRQDLAKVCFITNKQQQLQLKPLLQEINTITPSKLKENIARDPYINQKETRKITQNQLDQIIPKQNVLQHIPETPAQNQLDRTDIYIDVKDHLEKISDQDKLTLTFEEDTKKVHIMYLYDQEQKIQVFQLQIDFRIPMNHRSYICSNGTILLTGGVYRERNRFKSSDQVLLFDIDQMTLKTCAPMNFSRAIHQLCELQGYLYAVGGTSTNDENSSINKCEKYDLINGKWTPISDCKTKSSGSSLTTLQNKYLVKIGGKVDIFTPCTNIEIYDIEQDVWVNLDYQFSGAGMLRLPFNACAVTLNTKDILIFGGSVHDVKSNECSIIRVPENIQGTAKITLSKPLPRAVEFQTQSAFIDYNNIWVFEEAGGKKKVLNGSSQGWKEL